MSLGSIVVWLLAPHLLHWFFGRELVPAATTLRILAVVLPLVFINTTMFYVFVAAQRRSAYLTALALGVLVGGILSLVLAARYGADGSALADLLREFLVSVIYLCFLKAGDFAQSTGRALLKVLTCTVILTALVIFLFASVQFGTAWPAAWNLALVVGTLAFLGLPRLPELLLLADDDL
jgi:O-antigen/teichoic acid export membrane protein